MIKKLNKKGSSQSWNKKEEKDEQRKKSDEKFIFKIRR